LDDEDDEDDEDDDGCISGITVSPLFCQNFACVACGVCLVPGVFLEFSRCEGEMFGQRRGKWEVNGTDFPQNWQLLQKNMRFVQGGGP
jgi:hypothetical protein